jgi:nucleoside transporter
MRVRLSAMMFLQYAIWGAWAPVLWPLLTGPLGFSQAQAGWIFSALWLACLLAPFTGGQIADRWMPSQALLGVAHLAGGVLLLALSHLPQAGFSTWMALMAAYSLFYAPTLAVTNSLALRHLRGDEEFGRIRVWGTIGWIASGLLLSAWRSGWLPFAPSATDCVALAGEASIALGLYCFTLPKTPPVREGQDPLAFREALVLLRDPNTLWFLAIAFVVTTELQFYYGPTASFLESLGVPHARVPATMAVAQGAEILAMALALPVALRRLGLQKTLALGVLAWPLRYLVFAVAPLGSVEVMRPAVIASLTLHGIGFSFFFVGSQIFIDRVATLDIRASAQSLLSFATLGLGNFLGTLFTASVLQRATVGGQTVWTQVFLVPCALTVLCAAAFFLRVREPERASLMRADVSSTT